MTQALPYQFRRDLVITPLAGEDTAAEQYLIKDPVAGDIFELGREEFFICQQLEGQVSLSDILQRFQAEFGLTLSADYLQDFLHQMGELGLLRQSQRVPSEASLATAAAQPSAPRSASSPPPAAVTNSDRTHREGTLEEHLSQPSETWRSSDSASAGAALPLVDEDGAALDGRWCWGNPTPVLRLLVVLFSPIRPLMRGLVWLLLVAVGVAATIFLHNQPLLWQDIEQLQGPTSYLSALVFHLITINLASRLAIGAVTTAAR